MRIYNENDTFTTQSAENWAARIDHDHQQLNWIARRQFH